MVGRKSGWSHVDHFVRQKDSTELIPAALALAEDLTDDEVWLLNRNTSDKSALSAILDSAMANLELAFCVDHKDARGVALRRAVGLLVEVKETKKNEKVRHSAQTALDFMPLFESRVGREPYTASEFTQVYQRLGRHALTAVNETPHLLYEIFLFAIGARTRDPNYLILPSSVREEASSSRSKNYNHDGYVLRDLKIPIQAKSERKNDAKIYMPGVHSVYVRRIIAQVAMDIYKGRFNISKVKDFAKDTAYKTGYRYCMPPEKLTELLQHTTNTIFADSQGDALHSQDGDFIQGIQDRLCEKIDSLYSEQQTGEWPKASVSPAVRRYVGSVGVG